MMIFKNKLYIIILLLINSLIYCNRTRVEDTPTKSQKKMLRFYTNKFMGHIMGTNWEGIEKIRHANYTDSAYIYIHKCIKEEPKNYINHIFLLRMYYLQEKYDRVIYYIDDLDKKMYENHPADFDFILASAYDRKGEEQKSKEYFIRVKRYFEVHKNSIKRVFPELFEVFINFLIKKDSDNYKNSLSQLYQKKNLDKALQEKINELNTVAKLEEEIILNEYSWQHFLW